MASNEQSSPQQINAEFLSGNLDDPEMNEMWQGFVAYYKRSKSAEQPKTLKVESISPENSKQLTLDHWFGKGDKNAKSKPDCHKSVEVNSQRSLQTKKDTGSNNRSYVSSFEDIVPIESIPGPSTTPNSYTQAQSHPFGMVYDGAKQNYILSLKSPPNNIAARFAQAFHIVGPQVTSNSDLYGQILVDEQGVPIGNSAEPAIMYLDSSNEDSVAGHLNLSTTERTSGEEGNCEDVGIIYQSCDPSFSEISILDSVYVDGCGNFLPINSVETRVIDPNSFIPNATNVYSVTDQEYSEVISSDNLSKNLQNDTSHQSDLELNSSLRKSSRKKFTSDAKRNLTSTFRKREEKDSDNSVTIVSPFQEMNGDSDELNTSPFLLEKKYRLVTENICAETHGDSSHEEIIEVHSFDNSSCIEKERIVSLEDKDPSVCEKQTSTTFVDCVPKVFQNQLETNGTQDETTFVIKQSNFDFEVDRNKEFTSALTENIALDFEFDDVSGLKEKSNKSAMESSNSKKKSEPAKRKFRKCNKNMPDYLSPSVSKKIRQQRGRSISSEIQSSDIFEGLELPSDSTVENLDFDELSSELFDTNSDKVSSNETKVDSVKMNSKTLHIQKNSRNSHKLEPCADLITDNVRHTLKKDFKDSKQQNFLPGSYNLRKRRALCLSPAISSKRQKQAKKSLKVPIPEEASNETQELEVSRKRSRSSDSLGEKGIETTNPSISRRKGGSISPQKHKENTEVPQLGSPTKFENADFRSPLENKQKVKSVSPKCASTEKPAGYLNSSSHILNMLNSSDLEKDELIPDKNPKQQKKTKAKCGEEYNVEHDNNSCDIFHSTSSKEAKCACEETVICSVCQESTLNGKVSVQNESLQDVENLDIIIEIPQQYSPEKLSDLSRTSEEFDILDTLQSSHADEEISLLKSPGPVNSKKMDKESKPNKKKPKRRNTKDSCVANKNLTLRKKRDSTDGKQFNIKNNSSSFSKKMSDISKLAKSDKESPDSSIEDTPDFQYKSHSENEDIHKISKSQNAKLQNKLDFKQHSSERETLNTSINELDLLDIDSKARHDSLDNDVTNLVVLKHSKKQQTEKGSMCNHDEKDIKTKKRSLTPTQSGSSKCSGEPAEPKKKRIKINLKECEPALNCNSNIKSGENKDITKINTLPFVSEKHVINKSNSLSLKTRQTDTELVENFYEKAQNVGISEKCDKDISVSNQPHLSDSNTNSLSTSPNQSVRRSKRQRKLSKTALSDKEYEIMKETVKVASNVVLDQPIVKKKKKLRRLESDEELTKELVLENVPHVNAKQCTPPKLLSTSSESDEDSSDVSNKSDLSTRVEESPTLDSSVSKQPKGETKKSKQSKSKQKSESDADDVRTDIGLKSLAKTSKFSKDKSKSPQKRNYGKHDGDVIQENSEEFRKIKNNGSNLSCRNSDVGNNERDSSENVDQHIPFDPHDKINADLKGILEKPNHIPSCEIPKGSGYFFDNENMHSNAPRNSTNDSIKETIDFVCESNSSGELLSPNTKDQSEVNVNSKRKRVDDRKINATKAKEDDSNSELCDPIILPRKVSKREKTKKSKSVFKEKRDLSSEKSPLGRQKQSQLSPSSEQNRIQQSGSDCESNSFITSCNDDSKLAYNADDLNRFEKFVEKEKKHFMKIVSSEKVAEFLKIVDENPNGTIVMIPSDHMPNPESGPSLILCKEGFFQTEDSV